MDLLLLELLLWGGLLFLLWTLKDSLGKVESDLDSLALLETGVRSGRCAQPVRYAHAEKLADEVGTYLNQPIFRYALIDGKTYQFDSVQPPAAIQPMLRADERCLAPGLIYIACESPVW